MYDAIYNCLVYEKCQKLPILASIKYAFKQQQSYVIFPNEKNYVISAFIRGFLFY